MIHLVKVKLIYLSLFCFMSEELASCCSCFFFSYGTLHGILFPVWRVRGRDLYFITGLTHFSFVLLHYMQDGGAVFCCSFLFLFF